jgi:hypothetical protein
VGPAWAAWGYMFANRSQEWCNNPHVERLDNRKLQMTAEATTDQEKLGGNLAAFIATTTAIDEAHHADDDA